jgi:putative flippase GtrA
MNERPARGPERPRSEPEIIPPGDADTRARWSFDGRGTHRVYVARVGPFGFVLLGFVIATLLGLLLLFLLGAFVILIPLAGLLLAVAVVTSFLRGSFRR